jgi:membrane protease YdiL (CAAX protease family)
MDASDAAPFILRRQRLAVTVAAAGCAVLVLRPLLLRDGAHPVATLTALFVVLLAAGWAWPREDTARDEEARAKPLTVLGVGLGAFLLGRVLGGGHAPQPLDVQVVALGTLAAIAEEAFFRRFVYDALLPAGTGVAVVGSAVLFALVHVTVYGAWVLPIDLAAGLVLSWQRWASGSWKVPAVTHALANLLVVI